jgi:hypothetical protein
VGEPHPLERARKQPHLPMHVPLPHTSCAGVHNV